MNELIQKYKIKLAWLLRRRENAKIQGNKNLCISTTWKIQAYNGIIEDLTKLKNEK